MLTNVAVVPPPGAFWSELDIPVLSDNSGGVFIEKVDGLEPVSAEITTNGYNEQDGEFFVGSRVPKRNVVLHLIMGNRDLTVSQVRRNLYGYFMPKMSVTLRLDFSDRDSVLIDGYVESQAKGCNDTGNPSLLICEVHFLSSGRFGRCGRAAIW